MHLSDYVQPDAHAFLSPVVEQKPRRRVKVVSDRRKAELAVETPIRRAYLCLHPHCEVKAIGGFTVPPCSMDVHIHEPWTRARGGPTDDPRNFASACDWHNEWLSQDPEGQAFGEANNLLVSAEAGPAWLAAGGRMARGTTRDQALATLEPVAARRVS